MSRENKLDLLAVILISLTLPLFFYKLGQSSLVSFDEAWYAEIARNILKRADALNLWWNGKFFIDHPPAGFWATAISFCFLGVNDFSARAAQALAGFLTLIFLYFLGRKQFNRPVGIFSALALSSSPWFIFRARSGNLDSILTMFYVLTVLLAIAASENKKYLYPFSISLALLFLTKTAVPFTIIPVIAFIFWTSKKIKLGDLILPLIISAGIFLAWFLHQMNLHHNFLRHYFKIGLPGVNADSTFGDNLSLMKDYLHNGIGKWFWPGIISLGLGALTFQKRFLILFILFVSFFAPFLLSPKGHIWQLIPLHPFLILSFFGFLWVFGIKISGLFFSYFGKLFEEKPWLFLKRFQLSVLCLSILTMFVYFYYPQAKRNWYEFIDIPAFISDEAILSTKAKEFEEKLFIDEDFVQTAVFYSGKDVQQTRPGDFGKVFSGDNFLLITHQWRLDQESIAKNSYEILAKDRDKILVIKK